MTRGKYGSIWGGVALGALLLVCSSGSAQIRDGGIDPWNLGKGEWLYYMSSATNRLGGNVASVTNENSLMLFLKSQGIRYVIVKAATSDQLFNGSYNFPQFTSNLVNIAHANGLLMFGYNRSYGANVTNEIAISDYVFRQGADGFIWDAEAEWESNQPWITTNGPALAWQLCSAVRSNWPTKFLAHAPFPIISYHSSFPYKEFGYWSDAVMPQIYHFSSSGIKGSVSAAIEWSDANWDVWQKSLATLPPTNYAGETVFWTNAIKPLVPIQDVYGPLYSAPHPNKDVMEFIDYLSADPNCVTPGGYRGVNFFRADLHGSVQWSHIRAGTLGSFPGVVNNVVLDDAAGRAAGNWTATLTFYNGSFYGGKTDTNSFGTNYLVSPRGTGAGYVEFAPEIVVPGDYFLYQWHPFVTNASARVPFVINYGQARRTGYANQQTNSGNWSLVGRFHFPAGRSTRVRITDAIAEPDRVAIVDGLKFVLVWPPNQFLAWGENTWDQATMPGPTTNGMALAAGAWHSLLLRSDGTVLAWGDNWEGQCNVPAGLSGVLAVAAGGYHNLALRADGTIVAWGANDYGQTDVPANATNLVAIAAGTWHSIALRAAGHLLAWGDNTWGQCAVPAGLGDVVAIAAGGNHNLALRADGTVAAWGENTDALSRFTGQATVPPGLTNVVAIAAGDYHSLALRMDGTVLAWGDNSEGQCSVPPGLVNVSAISAGSAHNLVLTRDGTLVAWGADGNGQCDLAGGFLDVGALSAGGNRSLVLLAGDLNPPRLLRPAWTGGRFSLLLQTACGRDYVLEHTHSLAGAWAAMRTFPGNGNLQFLVDTNATAPEGFYRVRLH